MRALHRAGLFEDDERLGPDVRLRKVLDSLAEELGGIKALVVGDRSGLPIASTLQGPTTMTATAMATLALTAASKVTSSLDLPVPDDILIEAGPWVVVVRVLGNGFTLMGVFSEDTNIGLAKLSMQSRGREIRDIIDEMA